MQNSQKNFYKKLLGGKGELKVLKFLKSKGYKILEKIIKQVLAKQILLP